MKKRLLTSGLIALVTLAGCVSGGDPAPGSNSATTSQTADGSSSTNAQRGSYGTSAEGWAALAAPCTAPTEALVHPYSSDDFGLFHSLKAIDSCKLVADAAGGFVLFSGGNTYLLTDEWAKDEGFNTIFPTSEGIWFTNHVDFQYEKVYWVTASGSTELPVPSGYTHVRGEAVIGGKLLVSLLTQNPSRGSYSIGGSALFEQGTFGATWFTLPEDHDIWATDGTQVIGRGTATVGDAPQIMIADGSNVRYQPMAELTTPDAMTISGNNAAALLYREEAQTTARLALVVWYTADGGKTWETHEFEQPDTGFGDAAGFIGDRLYAEYDDGQGDERLHFSDDHGATWTPVVWPDGLARRAYYAVTPEGAWASSPTSQDVEFLPL
ncbi:MAG: hypothetical protein LBR58_07495 [Propionibacteriaceae bacterium]|jgi:hypothetical protein|nr:hypothetical protein [Propionibacteriaceae bacterium]